MSRKWHSLSAEAQKIKCRHFDEILVTSSTGSWTSGTASDSNFVEMTIFLFQGRSSTSQELCTRLITMMTSSKGNIRRVTDPLWGESTGQRRIPLTNASDAELWCFLWSTQTAEQKVEMPVIWDARYDVIVTWFETLLWRSLWRHYNGFVVLRSDWLILFRVTSLGLVILSLP